MNSYQLEGHDVLIQIFLYKELRLKYSQQRKEIFTEYGIDFEIYCDNNIRCNPKQYAQKTFIENNMELIIKLWDATPKEHLDYCEYMFICGASRYSTINVLELVIYLSQNEQIKHMENIDRSLLMAAEREDDNVNIVERIISFLKLLGMYRGSQIMNAIYVSMRCGNNTICKYLLDIFIAELLYSFDLNELWKTGNVEIMDYLISKRLVSDKEVLSAINYFMIKPENSIIECIKNNIDSGLLKLNSDTIKKLNQLKID